MACHATASCQAVLVFAGLLTVQVVCTVVALAARLCWLTHQEWPWGAPLHANLQQMPVVAVVMVMVMVMVMVVVAGDAFLC
jgi:hypothetical protein